LPDDDGLVYFNLATTIARGTEAAPYYAYVHGPTGNCWISVTSQFKPNVQAAIAIDSGNPSVAPRVEYDLDSSNTPMLFEVYEVNGEDRDVVDTKLDLIIADNDLSLDVKSNSINWDLRVGDWVHLIRDDIGLDGGYRIQKFKVDNGIMTLTCGKRVFQASDAFGDYLQPEVTPEALPIKVTNLASGTGSFTLESGTNVRAYFEETFSIPTDGTVAGLSAFLDIDVGGDIVPPGRVKLDSGSSVKIEITEYCAAGSNTVTRNLYNATGWESQGAAIKQYKALSLVSP
jgi:hypothetical protein